MNDIIPELDNWDQIENNSPSVETRGLVMASRKIVHSVVNLRLSMSSLHNDISGVKNQIEKLNNNLGTFNKESSGWANFFIALATLATAIAAYVAIFYRR